MPLRQMAGLALLALCGASLVLWPFMSHSATLTFTYDGAQHSATVDDNVLFNALRSPTQVFMPLDTTGFVSARSAAGNVWAIGPDGSVYLDGVPVPPPVASMTWVTLGKDFDTAVVPSSAPCRYGVPDHYVALTLAAGSYKVTPDALGVADPAFRVQKTLDCQQSIAAKAAQLTLLGLQTYARWGDLWKRWQGGQWVDAATTPAALLAP